MTQLENALDYQVTQYYTLTGGSNNTLNNIAPGNLNQVLTSNGPSSQPTYQDVPAIGALVKIQTLTASSSATLTFDSTMITNTYSTYLLVISSLLRQVSSGGNIHMMISTNNGSTYINTGYHNGIWFNNYNVAGYSNVNSTTNFNLCTGGASANGAASGTVWLYNLQTTNNPMCISAINILGSNIYEQSAGYNSNTTAVNNIQLQADNTFNFPSGTVTLYGLKQ